MFKKLFKLLIIIFPIYIFATPATDLTALLSRAQSMQADFSQTLITKNKSLNQTTRGVMLIQKPGRFRWEIQSPAHQLIVADGKQVWFYDVDLQQVTVQNLQRSIGNSPAMLLSGGTASLNNFTVSKIPQQNAYLLSAKNPNEAFQMITIYFDHNILKQMRMVNNLNQQSLITFTQVVMNPALAKSQFIFTPPKGVDVIRR